MDDKESFFQKVYHVVQKIPFGRVTSYGAIASFLGTKGSARMVGWAMNSSHHSKSAIPAHRVVNRNGMLTGKMHFGGSDIMQNLLKQEGIIVENDQIVNFTECFWDPTKELTL
jgi:methylated-DNA-protein-cysteine methyltransferase related protein